MYMPKVFEGVEIGVGKAAAGGMDERGDCVLALKTMAMYMRRLDDLFSIASEAATKVSSSNSP